MINKIFYILSCLRKKNLISLIKIARFNALIKVLDRWSRIFTAKNYNNLSNDQRQVIATTRILYKNIHFFYEDTMDNKTFQLETETN